MFQNCTVICTGVRPKTLRQLLVCLSTETPCKVISLTATITLAQPSQTILTGHHPMALSVSAFPASSRKHPAADRAPETSQSQNVTEKLRTRLSLRGLFRWASKSTRENDHLHTSRSPASSSPPISSPLSSSALVFPPQSPLQSLNSSPPDLRCTESRCFPSPDQQPEPDTHPQLAHQDIGKATNFPVVSAHAVLNPPAMVVHERLRMDRLRASSLTRTLPVPVPQRSIAGDGGTGSVSVSAGAVVGGHRKNTSVVSSSPHHSQIHVAQASLVQMPPRSVEEIKKEAFPAPTPATPNLTPNPGGYIRPLPPVPSPPPHPLPVIPVRSSSRVTSRSTSPNMRTRTRSTPDASHSLLNLCHHSSSGSPHSHSHRLTHRSDHSLMVSRGPLLRPDMLPSRALLVPVPAYSPSVSASQSALAVAHPYSSQYGTSKPPTPLLDLNSRPSLTLLPPDKMLGPTMPLEAEAAPFQAPVVYPENGGVFTMPELTLPAHGPTSEHIGENHHDGRPNSRAPDSLISWDPEGIDEPGLNPPELARISGTLSIGDDDERYAPVMEDYSSLFSRIPSPIYYARPSSQGSLSDEQSPKREPMLRTMAFSDNDDRYGKITDDDSSEFSSVPSPICYARPNSQGSLLDDLPFELPPISSMRAIGDNDHRNGKVMEDDSSGFSSIPSPICYARPNSEGSLSDDLPLFSTNPWSKQRTQPSLYGTPDNSANQTLSSATGSGSKSFAEPNRYRSDEVKHVSSFRRNISPTRHHTPSRSVTVDGSKMRQLSLFTRSPSPKRNVRPGRAVTADGSRTGQLPLFTRGPSPTRHFRPSRALTADSSKMQLSFANNSSPNQYAKPSGVVMADHSKMDQLPTFTRSPSPRRRIRSPRAATADSGAMGQLSLFVRSPSPKRHRRPGRAATADSAVNREGKSSRSGFLRAGSRSSFPPGNSHGSACGIGRVRVAESFSKDLKETTSGVRNGKGKGSSTGGRETATKGDARKGWTNIGMDNVVQDLVVVKTVRPRDGREEKAVADVVPKLRKMMVS